MTIEVVISDEIGSTSIDVNAETGLEAVIKAATRFVLKSIRDDAWAPYAKNFGGFTIEIEPTKEGKRAALYFINTEDAEGVSGPTYFESIE